MERLEHSISEARGMTKTRWGSVVQTDLHQAVEESREGTPKISWSRWHRAEAWKRFAVVCASVSGSTTMERMVGLIHLSVAEVGDPHGWKVFNQEKARQGRHHKGTHTQRVCRGQSPCRVLTKQWAKLSGQGKAGIFRSWLMTELKPGRLYGENLSEMKERSTVSEPDVEQQVYADSRWHVGRWTRGRAVEQD